MRTFETGATRDTDEGKPDFAGYLSPVAIKRFGEYMLRHQTQADGSMRSADNWKKGMPKDVYLSSMWRHMLDVWLELEGEESRDGIEDALCAIIFGAQGLLLEVLREDESVDVEQRLDGYCIPVTDEIISVDIYRFDADGRIIEWRQG